MKADICCLLLLAGVLIGFEAIAAARKSNFNLSLEKRWKGHKWPHTGRSVNIHYYMHAIIRTEETCSDFNVEVHHYFREPITQRPSLREPRGQKKGYRSREENPSREDNQSIRKKANNPINPV